MRWSSSRSVARVTMLGGGLAALLALGMILGCGRDSGPRGHGGGAPPTSLVLGDPLPGFDLARLGGGRLTDQDLQLDGPVVINFWATWCRPCVREIPTLASLAEADGVEVVSIALDAEGAKIVQPFVEEHGITYEVLLGNSALFRRFGGQAIPFTVVVDTDLRVRAVHRGLVSLRTLERDLAAARVPLDNG